MSIPSKLWSCKAQSIFNVLVAESTHACKRSLIELGISISPRAPLGIDRRVSCRRQRSRGLVANIIHWPLLLVFNEQQVFKSAIGLTWLYNSLRYSAPFESVSRELLNLYEIVSSSSVAISAMCRRTERVLTR